MRKLVSLLVIITLNSSLLFCGGFQINLQGQKQNGMGHTGTGLLLDNTSLFFNPGAVSFLDSLRGINAGGSFIFPKTVYLEAYPGIYTAHNEKQNTSAVSLYAVYKFNTTAKWNIGLGIYNPFGNKTLWQDDWKGQFLVRESEIKTLFIQPTFSYRVSDKIGIGAGFIYAKAEYDLRRGITVQDSAGKYGEEIIHGQSSGYGFNAGIYFKASEKLSLGVDYRSAVNIKINNGSVKFTVPQSVTEFYPETTFSADLKLPQTISVGIGYILNEKLKLALDINFVGWKSNDTLIIDYTDNTSNLNDIHSPQLYKNSLIFRIGGQYQINKKWTGRLGTYYDMSPVKSGYLSPENPDADKIGVSGGLSFNITKMISIDGSLVYIEGLKRTDRSLESGFEGTYKSKTIVAGIGIQWMF
jgi:long-chain fatty acid transport protein